MDLDSLNLGLHHQRKGVNTHTHHLLILHDALLSAVMQLTRIENETDESIGGM